MHDPIVEGEETENEEQIQEKILAGLRMTGVVNADENIVASLDLSLIHISGIETEVRRNGFFDPCRIKEVWMKRKTWISRELDTAGIKAQYDEHVKRILGSRQVLARILKGTIEGYRSYSPEEITCLLYTSIFHVYVPDIYNPYK